MSSSLITFVKAAIDPTHKRVLAPLKVGFDNVRYVDIDIQSYY
jgi:hypothetical protein